MVSQEIKDKQLPKELDTYHIAVMVVDHLNRFLELVPGPLVILLVLAHLFEQLLQDLTLGDVQRLVFVGIVAKTAALLSLLSFLALLLGAWGVAVLVPHLHDMLVDLLLRSLEWWRQDGANVQMLILVGPVRW